MISNLFWSRPRTNKTYIFTKFYHSKLCLFVNLLKLTSYIYMVIILFFRSFCIAGSPKCNKDFPGGFGEKVYSEFDVENNRDGGWVDKEQTINTVRKCFRLFLQTTLRPTKVRIKTWRKIFCHCFSIILWYYKKDSHQPNA